MNVFRFQYDLPNCTTPFSTICGGVSLLTPALGNSTRPITPDRSDGEINWLLKHRNTCEVFNARQTLSRATKR